MNKSFAYGLICAASLWSAYACASGGLRVVGATEGTQLMNNIELAASVAKQSAMVSEQVASKLVQIEQYLTMAQNLRDMPASQINETVAPYRNQQEAYRSLQAALKDLQGASSNAQAMFSTRGQDLDRSGLSLNDYMRYEVALANRRGGVYRQRLNQDIAAMDAMREKAAALSRVSERTSAITGNLQGLKQLNQVATMTAGELMEIKSVLLAQSAERNDSRAQKESEAQGKAGQFAGSKPFEAERAGKDRNRGYGVGADRTWQGGAER
jgi:type IV secretion system protein TrbJ